MVHPPGNPLRLVAELVALAQWDGVAVDGDAVWAVVQAGHFRQQSSSRDEGNCSGGGSRGEDSSKG